MSVFVKLWAFGCLCIVLLCSADMLSRWHRVFSAHDFVFRLPKSLQTAGNLAQMQCGRSDGAHWAPRDDHSCHSADAPPLKKDSGY